MKYRKIIFSTIFCSSLLAMEDIDLRTPENTKILWDFHEVIVHYNYIKSIADIWNYKWELIPLLYPKVLLNLATWALCGKLNGKTGEGWGIVANEYPQLMQSWTAIGNNVDPIPEVIELVTTLQKQGFTQELISDIDSEALNKLEQNPKIKPILALFNSTRSVSYCKTGELFKHHPSYFQEYLKHNKSSKRCIFIDDLPSNVENARRAGLVSIRFSSAAQLKKELENLGILEEDIS